MCGIAGHFSRTGLPSFEKVRMMNEKIIHRGPDAGNILVDGSIALAHRRLAIIDIDTRSDQPMRLGPLSIVYNGEVYNFESIRQELCALGHDFGTTGDCEVVLRSFSQWGPACVQKFKGMWAFAIFNSDSSSLFCSRDRFGIKPLYYKLSDDDFFFGSEIKQLLEAKNTPVIENIVDFLAGGYVDHNDATCFEGIYQLPAASNLWISMTSFEVRIDRYFELGEAPNRKDNGASIEPLVAEAISEHLVSDVTVGSCLSGGLDSSYVTSGLAPHYADAIAIHSDARAQGVSERDKAEAVAAHLDLKLEVIEPRLSEFKADLLDLVYAQEQPFSDPSVYMQFCVMRRASQLGIKVMLDGQGADEVFMGYPKYLGLKICEKSSLKQLGKLIRDSIDNGGTPFLKLVSYMVGTKFDKARRLAEAFKCKLPFKHSCDFIMRGARTRTAREFQHYELYGYPLPTLLRNEDRNSMFFSIEARVPYLDHELVRAAYLAGIEKNVEHGWTKSLLRNAAAKCLPEKIVYRKDKLGFNSPPQWLEKIPIDDIFKSRLLKSIFGKKLTSKMVNSLDANTRWRLLSVALWEEVFGIALS